MLLGWLPFGPRPRIDRSTIALAFIWPVAWILYTFVRGAVTGTYPVNTLGFPTALRNTMVVLAVGLVLALIRKLLDRLPALGQHRVALRDADRTERARRVPS